MSKVLQFLGIGKKTEGQGLQMLQTAQAQDQSQAFGAGLGSSQQNVATSKPTLQMSQVVSQNLPRERSNIMAPSNDAARSKIDVFNAPGTPGLAAQSQRFYTNSASHIANPVATNAPIANSNANISTRNLSAIEVYSTPVKPIEYDEIRTKLTNFVERTFPSPFPSRLSNPDDFDHGLTSEPYPASHIEFLLENSKYSDKSKENQRNKFLNYKKEIEFCKRYINMNEVKKQKLLQEIEDYKKRQGGYSPNTPGDAQLRSLEGQLQQQDMLLAQEQNDLERLRQQLQAEGGNSELTTGYAPGPYHQEGGQYYEEAQVGQFNTNAFSKKVNATGPYEIQQYQPESHYNVAYTDGQDQHWQGQQGHATGHQDYYTPQGHSESQNWGVQGGHQDPYRGSQHGYDNNSRQSQPRNDQYGQHYGNPYADPSPGHHQAPVQQREASYMSNTNPYGAPQHFDFSATNTQPQGPSHAPRQDLYAIQTDDFDPMAENPSYHHDTQYRGTPPAANKPAVSGPPRKNNPLMKKL